VRDQWLAEAFGSSNATRRVSFALPGYRSVLRDPGRSQHRSYCPNALG